MENKIQPKQRFFKFKFLIDPSFQGKLLMGIFFSALFSVILLVIDYYVFFGRNSPTSPWDPLMIWLFVKSQRPMIIQCVVFVIVLCMITIVVSNKVARPLYSLQKSIMILRKGDLAHRVNFREQDELQYIRNAFNSMIFGFQEKVLNDRNTTEMMRVKIEALLARNDIDAETRAKLEEIKALLETITTSFNV